MLIIRKFQRIGFTNVIITNLLSLTVDGEGCGIAAPIGRSVTPSFSIPNCLFERIRNEIILQKLLSDPFDALFFSSNCFVQKSNLNRLFFLSAQTVDRLLLPHKINLDKSRKLF